MWNIIGVSMIVLKWLLKAEDEEKEDEVIFMWVYLEKVFFYMYTWEGFSFIISIVGILVEFYSDIVVCTNLVEVKIFVKVDVLKVLFKEIIFKKEGRSFIVNFYYFWLSVRCKFCEKWGYSEGVCGFKSKGEKI